MIIIITNDKEKQAIINNLKEKLVGTTVKDIILIDNYSTTTIAIEFSNGLKIIGTDKETCNNVLEIFGED